LFCSGRQKESDAVDDEGPEHGIQSGEHELAAKPPLIEPAETVSGSAGVPHG
jgi:hypothetical protein